MSANHMPNLVSALRLTATLLLAAQAASCRRSTSSDDDWTYSGAVVRGLVTRIDGSPVVGASILLVVDQPASGSQCRSLAPYEGLTTSTITRADGQFTVQVQGLPLTEYLGCVSLHVRTPITSGLADTAKHSLRVVMRSEARPSAFDTLSVGSVVLRAK